MHLSVTKPGMFGGTKTTSLCGRLRTVSDGMNLTDDRKAVTCKFCLRTIATEPPPTAMPENLIRRLTRQH